MNKQKSPLTDYQIIKILDTRWSKFQDNYKDGNRTHSVFVQASKLCLAERVRLLMPIMWTLPTPT